MEEQANLEIMLNKLRYIEAHQTKLKKKKALIDEEEETHNISFTSLKRKEYKLIKSFNRDFSNKVLQEKRYTSDAEGILNTTLFSNMNKKLTILQLYLNCVGVTFMLKYLDMIVIVKRGGNNIFLFIFKYTKEINN